jgi:hypothetical protein
MSEFSEREKQTLLESAESQRQIHTYLMGLNGQPGFCERVESRFARAEDNLNNYIGKYHKLDRKVQWLIGILIGSGVISGSVVGITKLIG